MANITTLVPTSVALSSDAAIEAILSDIPLFCEGIMGIGVFTFLFLTKQVNILAVFLYGSAFLAFAAATLDLGQVLARGPQDTAKGIGLDTVAGFIYSREVFLSLALGSIDLFFWKLVAHCPREESPKGPLVSTNRNKKGRKHMHSASWDHWGLVGVLLKWGSLAALLSVPLLQIMWRTMPGQRKYGSIYVAETVIQTSVTFTLVLKLLLNVYSSPRDWVHAIKLNAVPIAALLIGGGLGIGNIVTFAFTESSLGRFLRAVEVYVLIVHSLYTTFQNLTSGRLQPETVIPVNSETKKFQGELPFAYSGSSVNANNSASSQLRVTRNLDNNSRTSNLSWILPRRTSSVPVIPRRDVRVSVVPSIDLIAASPQGTDNGTRSRTEMRSDLPQSPSSFVNKADSPKFDRPFTAVSLSYYTMEEVSKIDQDNFSQPTNQQKTSLMPDSCSQDTDSGAPLSNVPSIASQQGSITSLDEILRQQNELDKSIAALRLLSMQDFSTNLSKPSSAEPTITTQLPDQSRSTLNSTKTESFSNRSDFSLSIFPAPPLVEESQVATRFSTAATGNVLGDTSAGSALPQRSGSRRKDIPPITVPSYKSTTKLESSQINPIASVKPTATASQDDVNSAAGGSTILASGSQFVMSAEDFNSGLDDASDTTIMTIGSAVVLRPMILASLIMNSPSQSNSNRTVPANTSAGEATTSTSPLEPSNTPNLRPLFLGKPMSSIPPVMSRPTMVPLAQRRRPRGRTVTNAQRPVIGAPRLNSATEVAPGAFERPRPPPSRRPE